MKDKVSFSDSIPRRFLDAEYILHPQEIKSIDRIVHASIKAKAVFQKIFPSIKIRKGARKYEVSIAQEPSGPTYSEDFLIEAMDMVSKIETEYILTAIHKDYELSMIDIDAARSSSYHTTDLRQLHISEVTRMIADFKERIFWRGHDIKDADPGDIDTGVKGIMNYSGANTFEAGAGGDDKTGAAGDGPASVANATKSLVDDEYYPPYVCVLSPSLYAQLTLNMNSTTHITDIERMQAMVDQNGNKLLSAIHITPHLLNATDDGSASAMVVVATKTNAGEPTIYAGESYPVWHYPIQHHSLGIRGKVLWMGTPIIIRPEAITKAVDIDVDGTS